VDAIHGEGTIGAGRQRDGEVADVEYGRAQTTPTLAARKFIAASLPPEGE
jgi:hypothetical protein